MKYQHLIQSCTGILCMSRYIHGLCALDLRLQLILQRLTGILVLICYFIERKQFSVDISSKLGSSFSLVPFVIVVAILILSRFVSNTTRNGIKDCHHDQFTIYCQILKLTLKARDSCGRISTMRNHSLMMKLRTSRSVGQTSCLIVVNHLYLKCI